MNTGNQLPNLDNIFRDDEESDFMPSWGPNLAAIFGTQSKGPDVNSSTKQIAHKKTNNGRTGSQLAPSNKPDVIIAKAVDTFKLKNGVYISVGKLGVALIGNLFTKQYQIILYKSKQEHLSTVTLTQEFSFTVHPDNYASYYDSNNENWSILFENTGACIEFVREVALVRYFLNKGKMENIIYQDLSMASKEVLAKEGDNVTVKYFISTEIKQPFKSVPLSLQTMTVNISTDDNWERNLLGSNKGLKRILFLPPRKQISLGPSFPKEIDIMLEIEIIDINSPEESTLSQKQEVSGKASLLSRMAKMGQSMLPKIPAPTTTDSEDTEDDIPQRSPRHKKVELSEGFVQKKPLPQESADDSSRNSCKVVKPRSEVPFVDTNINRPLISTSAYTSQWPPTQLPSNFVTADGHVYAPQPQPIQPMMDPSLSMFLSEMRISQAEVRMGMSKISDNIQKVLDKFHAVELQNATAISSNNQSVEVLKKLLDNSTLKSDVSKECVNDIEERKRLVDSNRELTNEVAKLAMIVKSKAATSERKDLNSENKRILSILNTVHERLVEKFVDKSYSTTYIKSAIHNVIMEATALVFQEHKEEEFDLLNVLPEPETEMSKKLNNPSISFP